MSSSTIWIIVWSVIVLALFAWLWRAGQLDRLATYIKATREELKKCSWPSWEELKGSTLVISISILILGGFTMATDWILVTAYHVLKL